MAAPNRPPPRELAVLAKDNVTKNMIRVTLGGPGLDGFPSDQAGGYVKLRLPSPGDPDKRVVRTYTIRHQRPKEIDIDFALHGDARDAGPATEWAMAANRGDRIEIGGPGPAKPLPAGFGFYLMFGDMTSLPAISVNLEQLPDHARGIALIEVLSEDDRQSLAHPDGVEIRWLFNPSPGSEGAPLPPHARAIEWPDIRSYAWSACEFSSMRALRTYLRDERGLTAEELYISSYWKAGLNEEAHKDAKREDAISQ